MGKYKSIDGGASWWSRMQIMVPTVVVLTAVLIASIFADTQQRRIGREASQNTVGEELGLIRTKLEAHINANLRLMQGMVAVISTEPHMTQERFSALSETLLDNRSQIRNIVAAPNLVTTFVYPYERNKSFIGRRLFSRPGQEHLATELRDRGKTTIAGPVKLNNGGQGLVVTLPIRIKNDVGVSIFWGGLTGVIDLALLYDDSGLRANDLGIHVAITEPNASTGRSSIIYGDANVLEQEPVRMSIDLGNDSWTISAVPASGWEVASAPSPLFRTIVAAIAASIAGTVIWVAMLIFERQRNYAALHQREEQLEAVSHRLGLALEASHIGVWELNVENQEFQWDARIRQLYGVSEDRPVTYADWEALIDPSDLITINRQMHDALQINGSYSGHFRIRREDGTLRHVRTVGTVFRNHKGHANVLGVNWDVSADMLLQEELREAQRQTEQQNLELEAARRRMEYNSLHDALTGLPNRRFLDQQLADLIGDAGQPHALTVLHMDLDRFKEINDTLGHGAGDAILRNVARELQSNIIPGDFVARIGGDEFVIVSASPLTQDDYVAMGMRLIACINRPIIYGGHECRVGASIGIATQTDDSTAPEHLLVNADIALYEAKRRGRNRVEWFNDQLRARTINVKNTADAILRSLGDNDFVAYFQPQFDAHTLEINGAEALARWKHPTQGILAPAAFLEIAENLNVVAQIDATILEQALTELSRWRANSLGIEHVSVNISAQRLFDDKLIDRLETLTLKPGSLSFELLESISFDDKADAVAESLARIRAHGIAIEIDDFGTGYASILSLIKLSPSRLKIDRQLVAPIVENATQRRLISSIVDIGRSFGVGIVAEGVETMEHAAILRDLGCQTLQGYALARPMNADAFITFARKHASEREGLWQRRA